MRIHSAFGIRHSAFRSGFTLIELLVVIGIIALLAAILFPTIGKVRESARETDTRALITSIEGACQAYYTTFTAYPGPLSNVYIAATDQTNTNAGALATSGIAVKGVGTDQNTSTVSGTGVVTGAGGRVTAAENLVLGLLGGLTINRVNPGSQFLEFDPAAVGNGAVGLNPVRPTKYQPYMQPTSLSAGRFTDPSSVTPTKDTVIPEFVDRWPDPMPILVLRARVGGKAAAGTVSATNNSVVVNAPDNLNGQYNLIDITPYTQSSAGAGRSVRQSDYVPGPFKATEPHGLVTVNPAKGINKSVAADYQYPYDAFAYLADPGTYDPAAAVTPQAGRMRARKADGIILISAGRDRTYGTADDVANFGSVQP